jgi:hypothetical protein
MNSNYNPEHKLDGQTFISGQPSLGRAQITSTHLGQLIKSGLIQLFRFFSHVHLLFDIKDLVIVFFYKSASTGWSSTSIAWDGLCDHVNNGLSVVDVYVSANLQVAQVPILSCVRRKTQKLRLYIFLTIKIDACICLSSYYLPDFDSIMRRGLCDRICYTVARRARRPHSGLPRTPVLVPAPSAIPQASRAPKFIFVSADWR